MFASATVLRALSHERVNWRVRAFIRVLVARHLIQAALTRGPGRSWSPAGAAVDATHAATMAVLSIFMPSRRGLAFATAAGRAVVGVLEGVGS